MVGFNRRFAPAYLKARVLSKEPVLIRIEKHRITPYSQASFNFTLIDDYIHIVDTVLWLAGADPLSITGHLATTADGRLMFAHHTYILPKQQLATTAMHQKAGVDVERMEIVMTERIVRVEQLERVQVEERGKCTDTHAERWDSILKRHGFVDAVMHFIECVTNDTVPAVHGDEALRAQRVIEELIRIHRGDGH